MLNKGGRLNNTAGNRLNNQFPAFILFLLFSSLIWLTIILSGDYSASFTLPTRYVKPPPGLILLEASAHDLTIGMETSGVRIAMQKLFKLKDTIEVDLSDIRLRRRSRFYDGILLTALLEKKLAAQFPLTNDIHHIYPDTLTFVFAALSRKKVPVKPMITYQLGQQFMLYNSIVVTPDSVVIEGFADDIREIRSVESVKTDFGLLKNDVNMLLPLSVPQSKHKVSVNPGSVQLSMQIKRFTEASVVLPIITYCEVNEFNIRVFPETVNVTYIVALDDYKRVEASLFQIKVLCPQPIAKQKEKLNVEVVKQPPFVQITRIEPAQVEYIMVRTENR